MRTEVARLLALLVLFGTAGVQAQESATGNEPVDVDDLEPAVSSEVLSQMDSTATSEAGPETAPATVASDVRRTTGTSGVMDEIDLGTSEITGNQELPKVLYIVPWQKSEAGELVGKPVNTLLDEVLAPIDRSEFIRQVDYYSDLYGKEDE